MNFIGLLLVAFALFMNLKSYKNIFMSDKKKKELEDMFAKSFAEVDKSPVGNHLANGTMGCTTFVIAVFSFLFYLVTSIVVNNPIMYALAVIIFLFNIFGLKISMKSIKERKLIFSKTIKIAIPLRTLYIIGFIILFFI
ncbi:MAG: hypothetical protein ABS939_17180 [Psychrobacillus sp.]